MWTNSGGSVISPMSVETSMFCWPVYSSKAFKRTGIFFHMYVRR